MNAFRSILIALVIGFGALSTTLSAAPQKQTLKGKGVLKLGSRESEAVREAEVEVRPDMTFVILVRGTGDHWFSGTWERGGSREIRLEVRKALGREGAKGDGRLVPSLDGGYRLLKLGGVVGGQSFEVALETASAPTPGRIPMRALDASAKGSGEIRFGPMKQRLRSASVELGSGGKARLVLRGDSSHVFRGDWGPWSSDSAVVEVRYAFGSDKSKGRAIIRLTKRSFSRIELRGESKGTAFTADFRSN